MPDHLTAEVELIGEKVRLARGVRRLTQAEMSQRTGLDPQTIMRLELGRHTPQGHTLILIARALDVPLAWLLDPAEARMPWDD